MAAGQKIDESPIYSDTANYSDYSDSLCFSTFYTGQKMTGGQPSLPPCKTHTMTDIHSSCKKAKAFAWAKYYQSMTTRATTTLVILQQAGLPTSHTEAVPTECPAHIAREFWEMANELRREFTCPICMDVVNGDTIKITTCGHIYCSGCLTTLKAQADPKCAVCRRKL
jgi:hypothetical protein